MRPATAKRKLAELVSSPSHTVRVASRRAGEQVRATAARQDVFAVDRRLMESDGWFATQAQADEKRRVLDGSQGVAE